MGNYCIYAIYLLGVVLIVIIIVFVILYRKRQQKEKYTKVKYKRNMDIMESNYARTMKESMILFYVLYYL